MDDPVTVAEVNIMPEQFLKKKFCNEHCFIGMIKKSVTPEQLRGIVIHYKLAKEI